jgi:ketosteroid isomerase-like protein
VISATPASRENTAVTNVERVRRALAAFVRGDVEESLSYADPEIVGYRAPPLPDAGVYAGYEGVLRMWSDWIAEFVDFEMTVGDFTDAGERVVVDVTQRGKGVGSGVEIEAQFWLVYTLASAKVTRLEVFDTERAAVDAAGISGLDRA